MKYPITKAQWVGREIACVIKGHDWKSSLKWKPNKDELMEMDELPYLLRASDVGNPYLYQAAKWRYKCRRCRLQSRVDWNPIQIQIIHGFKQAWWQIKCSVRSLLIDEEQFGPRWKRLATLFPILILDVIEGIYLHLEHVPMFVLDWTCEAKYQMYVWIDDKEGQPSGVAT